MEQNKLLETYGNIKAILEADNIDVSDYKLIAYGLQFRLSVLGWTGKIRIYQKKRDVLKIDCSLLKGEPMAKKIKALIAENEARPDPKSPRITFDFSFPMFGIHESGKGRGIDPL
jgi:hypothetical protein